MSRPEMPIFTRTFDFLAWLIPAANHFPRAHRFAATQRLLSAAFDLSEPRCGRSPDRATPVPITQRHRITRRG